MSTKRSRKTVSASKGTGKPLASEVKRLFAKEWFKEAVKEAKLCYKEENSPENHQLLERAYFLRARQLVHLGMVISAVEVVQQLLEFGVTASDWVNELVRLLMNLGLTQEAVQIQERLGTPELKDVVAGSAADQAVVHPERALQVSPELARDASLVRASLKQLEDNDEAGALLLLRDLARSSPLSEWKFFVRGLAAHYRHDAEETKANWDRLDSKRKAFAIAQRLRRLAQAEPARTDDKFVERMETAVFGEPVLDRLKQANSLAAEHEWHKLFRLLAPLRHSLRRIDPTLAERLTEILAGVLIKEARTSDPDDTEELLVPSTQTAEPMSIDPHWNRFFAIAWDGPETDPSRSRVRWAAYIEDLKAISVFSSSERALAQAMIWNHLARKWHDKADALVDNVESRLPMPPFFQTNDSRERNDKTRNIADAQKKAIECLEKSLALAPAHLPTYRLMVEINWARHDPAGIEAAARRLLANFPDDVDTLTLLAQHSVDQNDHAAALPLVQKARAIKPLDDSLRTLEGFVRIGLARKLALEERWDEGRDQFRVADELDADDRTDYCYLARKAMFEAKAGQVDLSDRFIKEAEASLVEPTPLRLALVIESIRYSMPKATQDHYAELWNSDLKKKCRSETAGALASLLDAFLECQIEYPGRARHIKQVADYLDRASRLKYRRQDIERVCEFLAHLPEQAKLFEKRLNQGLKQHPGSVRLNLAAGILEIEKGNLSFAKSKARKHLEAALNLAQASTDPKETALLPTIKNALTLINEISASPFGPTAFGGGGFPFAFPGGGFPFGFDDDFDDDDDDDDDDDGPLPSWIPLPMPARKPRKPKSRKKR
jgi:hypothetical protein